MAFLFKRLHHYRYKQELDVLNKGRQESIVYSCESFRFLQEVAL